ncbi:MAG: cell shape determination protein CcmA [Desulfobulbus propionicus]|nr:MAG: cell shape determination protein CcmA [Desulfobulbus propionicus]
MALFNSKDEKKSPKTPEDYRKEASKTAKEPISSIISKEMHIHGEVTFKGKARLDGVIEGNVAGENFILSETGRVKGDLQLTSLVCHGTVEGNIKAKLVAVHSQAVVKGKLVAGNLTVEPGASLNGEISTANATAGNESSELTARAPQVSLPKTTKPEK